MNNIGIFCASSDNMDYPFYIEAGRLGEWIGKEGKTLVYGGANCGLMEATAKAVHENGGHVVGVVPQILIDRNRVSNYIDTKIQCQDLNDRKQLLIEHSDIIIAMPGSLGTLDEVFTVMASNTIGIHNKRVVFWNIDGFWNELFDLFESLKSKGVVNKPFEDLCDSVNTLEELIEVIEK